MSVRKSSVRPPSFAALSFSSARPPRWSPKLRSMAMAGALLGVLFAAGNARAAATTYTVNIATDSAPTTGGSGSGDTGDLRYALTQAETSGNSGSTIKIAATGTITLAAALPAITQDTTIAGPSAGSVTISGAGKYAIFQITSATAAVAISGVTIANGSAANTSGGILNDGILTVSNSTLLANSATGTSGEGGGITNYGTLTVTNSTLVQNSASVGGGIFNGQNNTLTVLNSTFSANSQSAINNYGANSAASLTVVNSILTGDSGAECLGNGCPTNGTNGNVVAVTAAQAKLLPLGNYGGTTLTMLPMPGSAAICAGTAAPPSPLTLPAIDQRGFVLNAANCTNGGVDAGAVQTNYQTATSTLPSSYTGPKDVDLTGLSGTVSSSGITISGAVNLIGPGANLLTLSGGNANQVLSVSSGASVALYGVTVANGNALT